MPCHRSNLAFYRLSSYDGIHERRLTWGPLPTVTSDFDPFRREESKIGILLNVGKCELTSKAPFNPGGSLAGFSTLLPDDAILLGALLVGRGLAGASESRCSDLRTAIARLTNISAHDALILLLSSFSAPKLLHNIRCTPCDGYPL